jgi:Domain of unknown function (DUF4397)
MKAHIALARIITLLGLLALAVGMAAGFAAPAASAASTSAGKGWLRLAHLSPNTPAVDVYLYPFSDKTPLVVLDHVAYGTVSGYQQVGAGEYTVAMRLAGAAPSSAPVLSTSVNIRAGAAYTVAGMGPANGLRLQVLRDRLTAPSGKAMVRIIQASLREHVVTIRAGTTVLESNMQFASVSAYRAIRPGVWNLSVTGRTEHVREQITLAAGTIHTIVVLDDPGGLAIDDLLDAAGSKVEPAGSPATGLGGLAPQPGPARLPWIVLACAGLALAAAGGWMARRPRSGARAVRTQVTT